MDRQILEIINGLVGRYVWLDFLAIIFSSYAGYVLLGVALVFLAIRYNRRNLAMVWWALVSGTIARIVIVELIRFFYSRPRPFEVLDIIQLIRHDSGGSFPSGHAVFFFAFGTALFFYNKLLGKIFLASALLIGIVRIFVGIHWPSDILAGAIIGVVVSLLVKYSVTKLKSPFDRR